ncbi:hypothetical protein RJ641_008574 [Dillenia turbinata]|uniref:CCR4-NOT transcription complex subunit 4 n=1 Tax=Dillenia turbinata TaxID=194707 RepID=A0AAN8V3K6_9MAGN
MVATMSDEGEKTCPLCAEEMDLTDQQLKPCKCGYEICVWCWHNIMNMAEKDETEGRCPACRVPYDKEKIVGMAANCERLVAEINLEKKKSQKAKSKTSEGRKQLSSVRVIQRNLVYVVGLPLNLADEDLLQRKEYFAQYGKVLKVSISRTASGAIQHFSNNTCSVYITYSKEEEAIRCIQSVHGYTLDGRSLRACFGTTKYCHAWLRNVPCSNPDCLYLHEIGSQEDSFTKDEIISAYTRVQQITGATNNMQRRSGSVLPPPADDYCCSNNSAASGKPIIRSATNNPSSTVRDSPPKGSLVRSMALPAGASWGMRASNSQHPAGSLASSNGPSWQKPDSFNGSVGSMTAVPSTTLLHSEEGKKLMGKLETLESTKHHSSSDFQTTLSEMRAMSNGHPDTASRGSQFSCPPAMKDDHRGSSVVPLIKNTEVSVQSYSAGPEKSDSVSPAGKFQNLHSEVLSTNTGEQLENEDSAVIGPNSSLSGSMLQKSTGNHSLPPYILEQFGETLSSTAGTNTASVVNGVNVSRDQCDLRTDMQAQVAQNASSEADDDIEAFVEQRLKDLEFVNQSPYLPTQMHPVHVPNHLKGHSWPDSEVRGATNIGVDSLIVDNKFIGGSTSHASGVSSLSNGYHENLVSCATELDRTFVRSCLLPNEAGKKQVSKPEGSSVGSNTAKDIGESSIISNILSMDFDPWDDSLSSAQNLAKLLGESDKDRGSLKPSSSFKSQNSNQSRFTFARLGDSNNQGTDVEQPFSSMGQVPRNFIESKPSYLDGLSSNGFYSSNVNPNDNYIGSHSLITPHKLSASRAQVSAPPGFSVPSRVPPGFSSQERSEQAFDSSGNHLLESSLLRNSYQVSPTSNSGTAGDLEFMDPAILAVGKGRLQSALNNPAVDMRSNFPSQYSAFENETRLQLLMQRSLSPHHNLRFSDIGESFPPVADAYGIHSRLVEQSQVNNVSPFAQLSLQQSRSALTSNGHWDGWSEVHGRNDLVMAERLRNERLGLNNFYTGYDDSKFRMPSSGDLYNRSFGI